jgi:hypothetical protein
MWTSPRKCLALALDATTFKQRFTVLSISVLYQQRAIPVAWTIIPANADPPLGKRIGRRMSGGVARRYPKGVDSAGVPEVSAVEAFCAEWEQVKRG